jgi:class 3 adenylate cyclase/tetratricopeptide (TPR) repeat protein
MCGSRLERVCLKCGNTNPPDSNVCSDCGYNLTASRGINSFTHPQPAFSPPDHASEKTHTIRSVESERKHVTVMFSDLSGYTAMSEKLDPEEVKEILNCIFGEVARVVSKYEGFIDKFIGDAVMVLFGVPKVHEDDAFRAIMAAREIHDLVEAMSPHLKEKIGQPITMHTGINTGIVVTDEMDIERGRHGMTGDAINLASRLTNMAKAGEILVGSATCSQAEGYFDFEKFEPARVKGKAEPVEVYKVLSVKERPVKIHRLSGLKADLIGRKGEMAQLFDAISQLKEGKGSIISISGEAGTGKSRLVEAFKDSINLSEIQWLDGHAYAYSQNMPYFPLIDFLNRVFHIEEDDAADTVRNKIESGIRNLLGNREDVFPYIGSLYSVQYSGMEEISPELWKSCLQKAVHEIISGLAQKMPTVICLEDLHWADPSSVELLQFVMADFRPTVLLLCVHRPTFSLFAGHEPGDEGRIYHELELKDLSPSDAETMVESLLKTETIPTELKKFIQDKVEGNPFYLEEVVNSLIESEMLRQDDGFWTLTRPIAHVDIPSTLQGVISARLDRLENTSKRVLQEASVIGRAFIYDILKRITELEEFLDECLSHLKQFEIIRLRARKPDVEYIFKHALTQEVIYKSLLRKKRRAIHEKIALVIEDLFADRLSEFYEMLAFHFTEGLSLFKALDYLIKSGEKSFGRYSLDESHQYYKEAFELLSNGSIQTDIKERFIIRLLNKWAMVYNQRGDYGRLINLLKDYEYLAGDVDDKEQTGLFYGWLGWALRQRERLNDSYHYLSKSLTIGEEINSRKVIGYASAWLTQTCSDLGLLEEAIVYGKRAQEMSELLESDQLFFQFCMFGLGLTYYFRGEKKKADEIGETLLNYGKNKSDIRSTAMGHNIIGLSNLTAGEFSSATGCFHEAIRVSLDPMISCLSMFLLGMSYLSDNRLQEAETTFEKVIKFNDDFGLEAIGTSAEALQGIVFIAGGKLSQGVKMTENTKQIWLETGSKYRYATVEHLLGNLYLKLILGDGPRKLSFFSKNIGFFIRRAPIAARKAEVHFNNAIAAAAEIGANAVLGRAKLDLGLLHRAKGRTDQARQCIQDSIMVFEKCEAEGYLSRAEKILSSL